jgi:hypothetical protein
MGQFKRSLLAMKSMARFWLRDLNSLIDDAGDAEEDSRG